MIYHRCYHGDDRRYLIHDIALQSDPVYEFLFDSRVESITTTDHGIPIPDEKPDKISGELWNILKEVYTTHSKLLQLMEDHETIFFVGGILENCVANSAYYIRNYSNNDKRLYYIPELSVSSNDEELKRVKELLSKEEIHPIKCDEAIKILQDTVQLNLQNA